jgi:hypothetical protein
MSFSEFLLVLIKLFSTQQEHLNRDASNLSMSSLIDLITTVTIQRIRRNIRKFLSIYLPDNQNIFSECNSNNPSSITISLQSILTLFRCSGLLINGSELPLVLKYMNKSVQASEVTDSFTMTETELVSIYLFLSTEFSDTELSCVDKHILTFGWNYRSYQWTNKKLLYQSTNIKFKLNKKNLKI